MTRVAAYIRNKHPWIVPRWRVLYIDEGRLLTSAGGFAGMDLCLHILRKDYGAAIASQSSQFAVTPIERSGGQAQFISHELPQSTASLASVLTWMKSYIQKDLCVEDISKRAGMSI